MLNHRSWKLCWLACLAAGGMSLGSATTTSAGNCGCCDTECHPCTTTVGCSCVVCKASKHNCLHKALDVFAGGVEKLFGLDKCGCDEMICDDACDAAMMDDLMLPVPPPAQHHHPHHHPRQQPAPVQPAPVVQPYSGPTQDIQLTPTGPSQWEDSGQSMRQQPRFTPPQGSSGQHLGADPLGQPARPIAPPVRSRQNDDPRVPAVDPSMDRESLFDTMSDPFRDDQTKARTYRSVRPSSYSEDELRPISKRPITRSYTPSSRRVKSIR